MIKKFTLLMVGLMLTASSHAQGTVAFANSATTLVTTNNGAGPAAVGSVVLQLYYMPKVGTNPPVGVTINPAGFVNFNGMEAISPTAGISPIAGRFSAGTRTTGNDVSGGSAAWFQVIGWSSIYPDFVTAVNLSFTGAAVSTVWSNPTGDPNGTPATNPQAFIIGPGGFNGLVFPAPEPSTIALGSIGAAAIVLLRFKRKRQLNR